MPKIAYIDCFSGASGDMFLGALLDLGLPLDGLRSALGSLAIEYGSVSADRVLRAGVSATKFRLQEATLAAVATGGHKAAGHGGGQHDHQHHGHAHDHGHAMTMTMATRTTTTMVRALRTTMVRITV